jgi:hypothetical protein
MRLLLISWIGGAAALLAVPATAQHALPARTFEASVAAVTQSPETPVARWWRSGDPRLRPTDQKAASALRRGIERSVRVRALAHQVEASDVLVYIGIDARMENGLAGRLTFVGHGHQYRYLRIALSPKLGNDVMVAALAHELQHVVEVIEHPEVTSERQLNLLYERIGITNRVGNLLGWETKAAQEVTYEVRRELSSGMSSSLVRQEPLKAAAKGSDDKA